MLVLTATEATQGQRRGDFAFAVPGELVRFPGFMCDRATPDDGCGCARAFAGASSSKCTTTAVVADLPVSAAEFAAAMTDADQREGWYEFDTDADRAAAVSELLRVARAFPPGTVVEKRGDTVQARRLPAAP